jgi:glycosyltransferase involved in cell wall biosynthesis
MIGSGKRVKDVLPILYFVVPCYNDAQTLTASAPILLRKLTSFIDRETVHPDSRVLFVNDGSSDNTWDTIVSLHAANAHVVGVDLAWNAGESNALLAGMQTAAKKADCVITTDSDLQDDIDCTDEMLRLFSDGNDVVLGVRTGRREDPLMDRLTSDAFYFVMRVLGTGLVRQHSNYRLLSRNAVLRVLQSKPPYFLPCLVCNLGLPTAQAFHRRRERVGGASSYTFRKRLYLGLHAVAAHTAARRFLPPERDPPFEVRTILDA